jgi:UDP-N-acetylmuramoylalanine--D-glutamate ligase
VLVIGAGRTGLAVARVLAGRGARVRLADRRAQVGAALEPSMRGADVEVRLGDDGLALLDGVDLVVPSPGVPATAPPLAEATARRLPVMSEIELAARLLGCPIVAVTGTNGKSTTTTMIGDMLTAAGARAFVGGNLGTPLIEAVHGTWDVAVAEVSTFQLEWVERFRPRIGVLLNVTPDHLDRHGTMQAYAEAKARLFGAQEPSDVAVLNRDDPLVWELAPRLRARVVPIGRADDARGSAGAFQRGRQVIYRDESGEQAFSLARAENGGMPFIDNVLAAVATARLYGAPADAIQSVLDGFRGLPHRCEFVAEARGVRYYDDSKATNVGAVLKSLESFPAPIVLLMGGLDKGADFATLRPHVTERVRAVVAYGRARERIATALAGAVAVVSVDRFDDAVARCRATALPGDAVLLAPGCASFDQFTDYAERGTRFQSLVRQGDGAADR